MSKKYQEKAKLVSRGKLYSPADALALISQTARTKFVESVDLAIKLGINAAKGGFSIRAVVPLPHGSGKKVRIAVIAKPDKVAEAQAAGAAVAGSDDLIEKISKGFIDFDILLATPDMMGQVGKLGKILGTKGLMPNPKSGTVTPDIAKAVSEFKAGKVEFRMDKGGVVHMILGKANFPAEHLLANLDASIAAVQKTKPSGTKGAYLKSITISNSMGPGIKIDPRSFIHE